MNASSFQDQFFSRSMHQLFNREVARFQSDEKEPAIRKYLRASNQL